MILLMVQVWNGIIFLDYSPHQSIIMETSSSLCSLKFKALHQSKSHNCPSHASVAEASTTFNWNNFANAYSYISHYNINTARSPQSFTGALLRLLLSCEHYSCVSKEFMKMTNVTILQGCTLKWMSLQCFFFKLNNYILCTFSKY